MSESTSKFTFGHSTRQKIRYYFKGLEIQPSFRIPFAFLDNPPHTSWLCHWLHYPSSLQNIEAKTRMHSSRMHTVWFSGRLWYGGMCTRSCTPLDPHPMSTHPRPHIQLSTHTLPKCMLRYPPLQPSLSWTEWLTRACENITFKQLRLQAVKIHAT